VSSATPADSFINTDVGAEGYFHDSDVEIKHVEIAQVSAGGGADVIDASAHDETGTYPYGGLFAATGSSGNDTLIGGSAMTWLDGDDGNDTLHAGTGETSIRPGGGDDVATGTSSADTADYSDAPAGVHVDLGRSDAQDTVGAGTDQLTGFGRVIGSKFDDELAGNGGPNVIDGGGGSDTVSYAHPSPGVQKGVTVSLAKPNQQQDTGSEGQDTLVAISNLIGSPFGDTLTGNNAANRIDGGGGPDTIDAGDGPDNVLLRDGISDHADCGGATDTVQSDWAGLDVLAGCENVDFAPAPATGGDPAAGGTATDPGTGTVTGSSAAADTTLTFRFTAKKHQRLGKRGTVKVQLSCPDEACSGEVSAKLAARSAAHRTIAVGAGAPKVVAMKLNARTVRTARAALRAGRKVTVRITAVARDAAGNRKTVTRKVVLGA
jgi:RTX calcium-binding nonapeptide repeat (4 copies)